MYVVERREKEGEKEKESPQVSRIFAESCDTMYRAYFSVITLKASSLFVKRLRYTALTVILSASSLLKNWCRWAKPIALKDRNSPRCNAR